MNGLKQLMVHQLPLEYLGFDHHSCRIYKIASSVPSP